MFSFFLSSFSSFSHLFHPHNIPIGCQSRTGSYLSKTFCKITLKKSLRQRGCNMNSWNLYYRTTVCFEHFACKNAFSLEMDLERVDVHFVFKILTHRFGATWLTIGAYLHNNIFLPYNHSECYHTIQARPYSAFTTILAGLC